MSEAKEKKAFPLGGCLIALLAVCLVIAVGAFCSTPPDSETTQLPETPFDTLTLPELSGIVTVCVWASPELQARFSEGLAYARNKAEFG